MLAKLNDILSKLPLNGKKSVIGVISSVLLFALPDFPIAELNKLLEALALGYASAGLLHKYVKKKIG